MVAELFVEGQIRCTKKIDNKRNLLNNWKDIGTGSSTLASSKMNQTPAHVNLIQLLQQVDRKY